VTDTRLQPAPDDWTRALAIAAHPDDLEYGASGAIAHWTAAGKQVAYLLATRGERGIDAWPPEKTGPIREAEERESARLVGVETVEFLDHQDGMVEAGLALRRDLARAIRRHRPELLITGGFDLAWPSGHLNQADHRVVGLAVCDAARDAGNRWIFPDLLTEGYEPWGGVRYILVSGALGPTHALDIGPAIEPAIASLEAQRAYFDNLASEFNPERFLRTQARQAGERFGCEYAVEFRLLLV
jgi:LmbE family N-acetylglucosaminyl deacetylase